MAKIITDKNMKLFTTALDFIIKKQTDGCNNPEIRNTSITVDGIMYDYDTAGQIIYCGYENTNEYLIRCKYNKQGQLIMMSDEFSGYQLSIIYDHNDIKYAFIEDSLCDLTPIITIIGDETDMIITDDVTIYVYYIFDKNVNLKKVYIRSTRTLDLIPLPDEYCHLVEFFGDIHSFDMILEKAKKLAKT